MVGSAGCDSSVRDHRRGSRLRLGVAREHPADGCRAKMKPSPAEDSRTTHGPHPRTQDLQALDQVSDQIREPIDGNWNLDERCGSFLVKTARPRGNREWSNEEPLGRLSERPAARGSMLED